MHCSYAIQEVHHDFLPLEDCCRMGGRTVFVSGSARGREEKDPGPWSKGFHHVNPSVLVRTYPIWGGGGVGGDPGMKCNLRYKFLGPNPPWLASSKS